MKLQKLTKMNLFEDSLKEFIENFDIKLSNKKLDKIKDNILNNVLIIDNFEYNIENVELNKYEIKRYKINKDKDIKFLFGCKV